MTVPEDDPLTGTQPEAEAAPAPAPEPAPEAAPAEPEVEEAVTLRFRGEEKMVPKRLFDELRDHLGADDYTTKMRLQRMWDADRVYNETAQERQEWQRREAEYNARVQALEAERQARVRAGQPATQPQAEDDPIAILKAMRDEFAQTRQSWEEERQAMRTALEEQYMSDQASMAHNAYEQFMEKVKSDPRKLPVIPEEALVEEAISSGLAANRHLGWPEVYQRAYRNLAWDMLPQAVEKAALERMRKPTATVTVTSGRSPAPQPANPKSDIDKVPFVELLRNLPEGKF